MELLLSRFSGEDESTLGLLFAVSEIGFKRFLCFTLEDQFNDPKVPGETRIPEGRYKIELRTEGGMHERYSDRFGSLHKGMLWLQDVPDFTFVYIHYGNYDDETEGCILVGDGAQSNLIEDGMVTSSVAAYKRLYREIVGAVADGLWLDVKEMNDG